MASYDYLTVRLERGPAARARFVEAAKAAGLGAPAGLFAAQLGWEAAQVALLVRRPDGQPRIGPSLAALAAAPEVKSAAFQVLTPTVRPREGDQLAAGGVYVHRWFEVAPRDVETFVALSAQAWPDFEARFEAHIFGLFELEASADPAASRRLLLVTRYASHGVWEDSRDPTTEAMQTFARRAQLTLSTQAASTLLIPL
jgi:hypothetical protein